VIFLGLASRYLRPRLPVFLGRYAGDTLWATAVYLTITLLRPAVPILRAALATAVIALCVELSQLAHPAWLDTLRGWPGVGLLLGYDFVPSDLACYAVGAVLGVVLDLLIQNLVSPDAARSNDPARS
jgi:hypothetical protein